MEGADAWCLPDLCRRRPAVAWLRASYFIPIVGVLLFLLIGNPRLPRKKRQQQEQINTALRENGENVSVGHNAVVHGCTVEDGCLIGMGSVILSGAVIGAGSLVAGGALVLGGTIIPPGSMVAGVPAKVRRELTDEEKLGILRNAEVYRAGVLAHREARDAGE